MIYDTSFVIFNDKDINLNSAALLAKELIVFYRTHEDHIKNLSLRELQLITDLLLEYINKIKCTCLFKDCNFQKDIKSIWDHSLTCQYNPYYVKFKKNNEENKKELEITVKKLEESESLKPFQVDYYTSLSESYLKENRYLEAREQHIINNFVKYKNHTDWNLFEDKFNYKSWTKKEEGSVFSIKVNAILTAGVKDIFYYVDRPENIQCYNKYCVEGYTVRQINTNTRLMYFKCKPGFGESDFVSIQNVLMNKKTAVILRTFLNENESPHKYTPKADPFVKLRRGILYLESFEIKYIDSKTTEIEYMIHIDYKLEDDFGEVIKCLCEKNFDNIKNIKSVLEKKEIDKFYDK